MPVNAGEIIKAAREEGRSALFETEAKEILRGLGAATPKFAVADAGDEKALAAAGDAVGYPLALKAVSPGILHKTDVGAVMLNITAKNGLLASATMMKKMLGVRAPDATVRSFLVERMMPQGVEFLVGGLRDPQFGPALSFGLGGVLVEALQDAVFGILPMTRDELLAMINETRAGAFLAGKRSSDAPPDRDAVLTLLETVGRLLTDVPEIKEIDLNPVRVYVRGATVLDARIVLA